MLQGKTVLVTGSSRGIGAVIARLAKRYGAEVILHGRLESKELTALAKELDAPFVTFDVSDDEAVRWEMSKLGKIDVLVNNAGINPSKTFQNLTNNDWKEIFGINFFGAVNVSRVVLEGMTRRKNGAIINIASIKGFPYVAGKPAYAASKAALIQFTARMAEEFAPQGIRINAVAPGFTETELTTGTLRQEEAQGKTVLCDQIAKIPMKRMANPQEIAEVVLFLASDKASYINGQCLAVDGGLSIV
ncbi:MAG: SDR family oxidoreductase [Candidatus Zambryskibacteria bacterium]|nr:SDR family oxidoreductase [Candidatus Zambryskibacteria bacterium]